MKPSYIVLAGFLALACGGVVVDGEPEPSEPEPSAFCLALANRMTDRYLAEYPAQQDLRDSFIEANLSMCAKASISGPYPNSVEATVAEQELSQECGDVMAVDSGTVWGESIPPYFLLCVP